MFCAFRASKNLLFSCLGLLAPSGPHFGPPGVLLGASLGASWAPSGSLWRALDCSWRLLAALGALLAALGSLLCLSWASLGLLAGPRPRQGPILDATRAQRGQKSHKTYENTFRNHCSERLSRPLQPRCTEPRMHSTMLAQWPVLGRRPCEIRPLSPCGSSLAV